MGTKPLDIAIQASLDAFERARCVIAGGVNSPVRAFKAVGGAPRFMSRGTGATLTDVDGNTYIDYVGSWGPMILGHADECVSAALTKAMTRGWSYGAPTEYETALAERIVDALPSIERVRFVNSGTEAAMSAVRLARGYTGRDVIIKCAGCYHGHADALLADAGSGPATFATPASAGVPTGAVHDTIVIPYNDLDAATAAFDAHDSRVAALLIEPVPGNMGLVLPQPGYLQGLRALCDHHHALLIFDEVMTGFRVAYGGAQTRFRVAPDLTCLGKIIGGGLPVGAYGGRTEIMSALAPDGPVYQAGTLSGNPLAMAAGIATLDALAEEGVYDELETLTARLADGLQAAAEQTGVATWYSRLGSMQSLFFTGYPVIDFATASSSDENAYRIFFQAMLDDGIYLPPSRLETWFVSLAHTPDHIDRTIEAATAALTDVAARLT